MACPTSLLVYDQNFILTYTINNAHGGYINQIKYSPYSNGLVFTGSDDAFIRVWDANNQYAQVKNFLMPSQVKSIQFINVTTFVGGSADGSLVFWSLSTGLMLNTLSFNPNPIFSLSRLFNTCFMAAGVNTRIAIINVCALVINVWLPDSHTSAVNNFELAQSDTILISSSNDFTIKVWSLNMGSNTVYSGSRLCNLIGHTNWVYGLKMVSSTVLASGACDNTIKLWNILSGSLIQTLSGHTAYIMQGLDLFNSSTIISGSWDSTIKLWSSTTGSLLQSISISNCEVRALAIVSSQGKLSISLS